MYIYISYIYNRAYLFRTHSTMYVVLWAICHTYTDHLKTPRSRMRSGCLCPPPDMPVRTPLQANPYGHRSNGTMGIEPVSVVRPRNSTCSNPIQFGTLETMSAVKLHGPSNTPYRRTPLRVLARSTMGPLPVPVVGHATAPARTHESSRTTRTTQTCSA